MHQREPSPQEPPNGPGGTLPLLEDRRHLGHLIRWATVTAHFGPCACRFCHTLCRCKALLQVSPAPGKTGQQWGPLVLRLMAQWNCVGILFASLTNPFQQVGIQSAGVRCLALSLIDERAVAGSGVIG